MSHSDIDKHERARQEIGRKVEEHPKLVERVAQLEKVCREVFQVWVDADNEADIVETFCEPMHRLQHVLAFGPAVPSVGEPERETCDCGACAICQAMPSQKEVLAKLAAQRAHENSQRCGRPLASGTFCTRPKDHATPTCFSVDLPLPSAATCTVCDGEGYVVVGHWPNGSKKTERCYDDSHDRPRPSEAHHGEGCPVRKYPDAKPHGWLGVPFPCNCGAGVACPRCGTTEPREVIDAARDTCFDVYACERRARRSTNEVKSRTVLKREAIQRGEEMPTRFGDRPNEPKPALCIKGCHLECNACARKPGTPTLCSGCLSARRACNADHARRDDGRRARPDKAKICDYCDVETAAVCKGCLQEQVEEAVDHYVSDDERGHCIGCVMHHHPEKCPGLPRVEQQRAETPFPPWTLPAYFSHVESTGTHEQRKAARILRALFEKAEGNKR